MSPADFDFHANYKLLASERLSGMSYQEIMAKYGLLYHVVVQRISRAVKLGFATKKQVSQQKSLDPSTWLEYHAQPVPESGCWLFNGATNRRGYGKVSLNGKHYIASRAAFIVFNGPIPDGMFVCHTCDVPLCINPKHLFLGTPRDNVIDMKVKGRAAGAPRKDKCIRGHPLVRPGVSKRGGVCYICTRATKKRYRARLAAL